MPTSADFSRSARGRDGMRARSEVQCLVTLQAFAIPVALQCDRFALRLAGLILRGTGPLLFLLLIPTITVQGSVF